MRSLSKRMIVAAMPLLAIGAWGLGAGCENTAGDCELTAECTGAPGGAASCEPAKAKGAVAETCGVFVKASAAAGGDGTRGKPFATIAEALAAVKDVTEPRIYACAETFAEAAVLPGGVTLYGGLDCAKDWVYSEAGRTVIAPGAGIPLTFEAGATTHVENVRAEAPDAAAPTGEGQNGRSGEPSIAALAEPSSKVDLVRCELTAGAGAGGIAGDDAAPPEATPGGNAGSVGCASGEGGVRAEHVCPDLVAGSGMIDASGGRGADGAGSAAGLSAESGAGVAAGTAGHPQTMSESCTAGEPGGPGQSGNPGSGGGGEGLSLDGSRKGAPGEDGTPGAPGSGGGGGGGGDRCQSNMTPGPGGGSGGPGGCGGVGGLGGGAGGSSIALFAVDATVSLASVVLIAGPGGAGAPGAAGQSGAAGGAAGMEGAVSTGEGTLACAGGAGGKGGDGGPGGGGAGGHSIAAVWTTPFVSTQGVTLTAGVAGDGGDGMGPTSKGASGIACGSFDLENGACVTP